ncbi:MAG: hypothetical protein Q8O25_17225 [Sulfurisoma sp.]|nr:hypothetical protein [Sulfurisoma sp.]
MNLNKKILMDLVAILGIVLIAVVGYKLSPLLLPKADITATVEPGCDLHKRACAARLPDGGRIELSIVPRPIPTIAPLQVEVKTSGMEAGKVEIDFAGVDMNMGYNRPELAAAGPGVFRAEALLPVCVTGKMAWAATVIVETGRNRIAAPFRFNSVPD